VCAFEKRVTGKRGSEREGESLPFGGAATVAEKIIGD